jgi:endoglucanase
MVRYGFPGGPIYNGTSEDRAKLRKGYERKAKYSKITDTPVWNGEFGIVYATPDSDGADWERVNDERYACLRDQLRLYADDRISWTIWLYKDIGVQGMVHTPEDSLWNRTFADSLAKKRKHALDFWGTDRWD